MCSKRQFVELSHNSLSCCTCGGHVSLPQHLILTRRHAGKLQHHMVNIPNVHPDLRRARRHLPQTPASIQITFSTSGVQFASEEGREGMCEMEVNANVCLSEKKTEAKQNHARATYS